MTISRITEFEEKPMVARNLTLISTGIYVHPQKSTDRAD